MQIQNQDYDFATKAVHSGIQRNGPVVPPISLSVIFEKQEHLGQPQEFSYSRKQNPSRQAFEQAYANLYNAKYGFAYSSGVAALQSLIMICDTQITVLCLEDIYGGTRGVLSMMMEVQYIKNVIYMTVEQANDEQFLTNLLKNDRSIKMIFLETLTNPLLYVIDLEQIVRVAKQLDSEIMISVDNTFASPYLCNPLKYGVDIVNDSCTKFIGGHSDILMGAIAVNNDQLAQRLTLVQTHYGNVAGSFECTLAIRGLKTLKLRMKQQSKNAAAFAQKFQNHPFIEKLMHPSLENYPQKELARKYLGEKYYGGIVSCYIKAEQEAQINVILQSLQIFTFAGSLGCVESLTCQPANFTHS